MGNTIWKPDDDLCFLHSVKETLTESKKQEVEKAWQEYNDAAAQWIKKNRVELLLPDEILTTPQIEYLRMAKPELRTDRLFGRKEVRLIRVFYASHPDAWHYEMR